MEEMSLGATIFQTILALGFVIILLLALAYGVKRLGLIARVTVKKDDNQKQRLNIIEILPVDAKRRLVLIRRDDKEHLIMLGAERDLLIENNIDPTSSTVKNISGNKG